MQGAVQSMTMLTFGFMDFETFVNGGLGLGEWKPVIIIVFWVVVMVLIVISQNIVLSIVVRAYDTVGDTVVVEAAATVYAPMRIPSHITLV